MNLPVKRNKVINWIRTRVSDGTLVPGEPVPSSRELSRITGYSVITCRNALRALQAQGVVITGITPNSRLRVAGPSSGQALLDATRALCDELIALRRAAGLRQPDLADLIGHSLTSVGHAETGRLWHSRDWWELVDKTLDGNGKLIRLHDAYRAAQVLSKTDDSGEGSSKLTHDACDQGTPDNSAGQLLTADERTAIRQAGQLYVLIAGRIIGHGPTRDDDLTEIRTAIHVIQRAIESQAAARAYPKEFRLLGREISRVSPPNARAHVSAQDAGPQRG